jgi:hypothetical protein
MAARDDEELRFLGMEPGMLLFVELARRVVSAADIRFLTGRCNVSKAKSDKTSPDLDTPTDIPPAAVDKISASLNLLEDQELPLARQRPAFPRLPFDAG